MALFLYLAGAVFEAIETAHREPSERDGEDRGISRQHGHCTFYGIDHPDGAAGRQR